MDVVIIDNSQNCKNMKKIILFLTLISFFSAFTSFKAPPPAIVIDEHHDFPGPYDLINECTGETVTVTGNIGIDMHIVINGNRINYSEQQQGLLEGTGSLGNTYLTHLNENIILNGSKSNETFIINDVTIFRMTTKGGAPNFFVRRIAHLTVTADGVVTVDRIDFETFCRG